MKGAPPATRVVAVEPEGSRGAARGLAAGKPVTVAAESIADGLERAVRREATRSPSARELGVEVVLVSEEEIEEGFRFLYGRAKLACEPAGAAADAALLAGKVALQRAKPSSPSSPAATWRPETASAILAAR